MSHSDSSSSSPSLSPVQPAENFQSTPIRSANNTAFFECSESGETLIDFPSDFPSPRGAFRAVPLSLQTYHINRPLEYPIWNSTSDSFGMVGEMANDQAGHANSNDFRGVRDILSRVAKFTGRESAPQWLREFKRQCALFGHTTQEQQHNVFVDCQAGEAKTWSTVYQEENPQATPEQFVTAWTAKWLGDQNERQARAQTAFDTATKGISQKYVEFGTQLKLLAMDMDPKPNDRAIIVQCLKGVSLDAKERIADKSPKTMAELMTALEKCDEVAATRALYIPGHVEPTAEATTTKTRTKKGKREKKKEKKSKVNLITTDPNKSDSESTESTESDSDDDEKELRISKLEKAMKEMTKHFKTFSVNNTRVRIEEPPAPPPRDSASSAPRSRPRTPYRGRSQSRSNSRSGRSDSRISHAVNNVLAERAHTRCYKCDREGHFARECPDTWRPYRSNGSRDYDRDRYYDRGYSRDRRPSSRSRERYRHYDRRNDRRADDGYRKPPPEQEKPPPPSSGTKPQENN